MVKKNQVKKKHYMIEESKTRYGFDHFKKDGEVKKSYSRKGAYGATLKIMEVFGNRMSHYKCPTCGDYHIGKFTGRKRNITSIK